SLYEKKIITYPRTNSQYISEDVFETIPALMEAAATHKTYGIFAKQLSNQELNRRVVDANKIEDHHAILTTGKDPEDLCEKETKVYALILSRIIISFSQTCFKDVTKILINCGGIRFTAKGNTIKDGNEGWRLLDCHTERQDKETEENQTFPDLSSFET